ncbi:MAG TPA: aluminum resistance family protein [Cyanobacteria bacterium UBA8530]|nr:aluminum resistance family protein [Cyanobacteria bacterium UBA8530]
MAASAEELILGAERELAPVWSKIEEVLFFNQEKVLDAFREFRIGEEHFAGTTGYGHDDLGREALEKVYARVFKTEAALVRGQIASGTHAIAVALFGMLSPGDELLFATGAPYDTLEEVIGLRGKNQGSLLEWGVSYRQVELGPDGMVDLPELLSKMNEKTKVVAIQRSRGYSWRPSLTIEEIEAVISAVKKKNKDVLCFVDNCYGEFTEKREPTEVGADLVAGSLIKNPGGGIVPAGGYLAGKEECVERAACRLTAPGIGRAGGATVDSLRLLFQGFFMAAPVVAEALKGATLAARLFQDLGYSVDPLPDGRRSDIIQAIRLGDPELLIAFCKGIQESSPIHSYVQPIPDVVPGYEDDVVMAAGTFIEGSTIELSADGPLRSPYAVYLQGGLSYAHCRIALGRSLTKMREVKR